MTDNESVESVVRDGQASAGTLREVWNARTAALRTELIVDVAMDLLRLDGIQNVSMRKIASKIGVGTMTLYTYVNNQIGRAHV